MESTREVLSCSDDGVISYVRLTEDLLEDTIRVMQEGFYPFECVSIASDIIKNPKAVAELNLLVTECIKEEVSIAAIDTQTNKLIGVSVNKIQENDPEEGDTFLEKFVKERCEEKESAALINTMIYCDSSVNLFQYLKVNKVLELIFVTVVPDYRKRGIGLDLIKYDLKLLEKLSVDENGPKAAFALFSSTYSQLIGEKLDFEVLLTINYNTFTYNGVKFSNKIESHHKGIKLAMKRCVEQDPPKKACPLVCSRT